MYLKIYYLYKTNDNRLKNQYSPLTVQSLLFSSLIISFHPHYNPNQYQPMTVG